MKYTLIRVLHVVGKMDRGGMETLIMNYYRKVNRNKIQFDFLVHYEEKGAYDDEIKKLGGKIYRMPRTDIKNYFIYKKELYHFFKNHPEYKIIHGHLIGTAFLYHKVAKMTGRRFCITHAHSTSTPKTLKGLIGYFAPKFSKKYTDDFFTCSMAAAEFYFGSGLVKKNKVELLHNAIDVDEFVFNHEKRKKIRKKLNIENCFVIGNVGGFREPKNHDFMIDIFSEIYSVNKNARLLLVGKGPLEDKIKEKVESLNLKSVVMFLGIRSDVSNLLQGMDVFLMPSLYEGLPVAGIEAQATGIACIMSENVPSVTKITDLVEFISLEYDSKYWARKILTYSMGYERADTSESITKNNYNVNVMVKSLEDYYAKASLV